MKRRFLCTVTKETEILIELDDELVTPEWMEEYSKYFSHTDDLEDVARQLAWAQAHDPHESFIEGFGHVTRKGKLLFDMSSLGERDTRLPVPGMDIVDHGSDTDVELVEIK